MKVILAYNSNNLFKKCKYTEYTVQSFSLNVTQSLFLAHLSTAVATAAAVTALVPDSP